MGLLVKYADTPEYDYIIFLGDYYIRKHFGRSYYYLFSYDHKTKTVAWCFDTTDALRMPHYVAYDILKELKGE